MPERATISQVVQWGVESVSGTAVAADRRLPAVEVGMTPQLNVAMVRGSGYKYPAVAAPGREWVEAALGGRATYNELIYLLSSVAAAPGAAVQIGTTGGYTWDFAPSSISEDTVKTFTIEQGSAVRAHRIVGARVGELSIDFNRDDVNLGGSMMGHALEDAITMTAAPTDVGLEPVLGQHISVYLDTTGTGAGTTKLGRLLDGTWRIGSRSNPLWVVDRSQTSFVAHVETPPDASIRMRVEADAAGMALLPLMRAGQTRFVRIEAVGPNIGTLADYKLVLDTAVKFSAVGALGDADGVYAIEFTGSFVHDATWGKSWSAQVVNKRSTL